MVRLDFATHRNVPWDDQVPFFLGDFQPRLPALRSARASREARDRAHGEPASGRVRPGVRVVQLRRDAADRARQGRRSDAADAGHVRLLGPAREPKPVLQRAVGRSAAVPCAVEGLHTETGPGVFEAAIVLRRARGADRAVLFKSGAKEIGPRVRILPTFMAKWNLICPAAAATCTSAVGRQEEPVLRRRPHRMSSSSRATSPARRVLMELRRVLRRPSTATSAWSTVSGRRPSRPGRRQPHRGLSGDPGLAEVDPARDAGARARTSIRTWPPPRSSSGLHGVEKGLSLTAPPVTGSGQGSENARRAPR